MKQLDLLFCLTLQFLSSEPLILPESHNPTDNIQQDLVNTLAYYRQTYVFTLKHYMH